MLELFDMEKDISQSPIGIFDSGIGGLSVLKAMVNELPDENLIYLGDQANVPYGLRPLTEVRKLSEGITEFFLEQKVKAIVVACNTASAAALHYLREKYPSIQFIGMEPAVKPAAENTHTGKVGVLATSATFQGELYASVVERFAQGVELFQSTCPGLVNQIEKGRVKSIQTKMILRKAIRPMLAAGIDTIVLGCTHYPFVMPGIQKIAGSDVRVIDPAPAVARQVRRVLEQYATLNKKKEKGEISYLTSGNLKKFSKLLSKLLASSHSKLSIYKVEWEKDRLVFTIPNTTLCKPIS